MENIIAVAKSLVAFRRQAYVQVFSLENRFAAEVLKDLSEFCRATDSTFHTDPRAHALLEGRREVWLRIQKHLNLNEEELWKRLRKGNE